jgi:hypothetical protein
LLVRPVAHLGHPVRPEDAARPDRSVPAVRNALRLMEVLSVRPKAALNVPKVLTAPPAVPVDAVLVHLPFVFSLILNLKMRPRPVHCRPPPPEQPRD